VQTDSAEQFRNPFGRPIDFNGIEVRCGYTWNSRKFDQFFDCRVEPSVDGIEDFFGCGHGRAG
jgi:hypothetical protein